MYSHFLQRLYEVLQCVYGRPPSSSLSYTGPGNDDARSPGSGGTPGPLSQPPNSHQSADNGSEAGSKRAIAIMSLHS
ncbi:unnamed protein product [Allacma fusca]|uniref:Uncharacterized protein n=1 Tax=Allacma fusca TaxID=39272 RepID=A0A8J2K2H9_9HEXA|nr:unnamed protein product [Allacma fusca]